MPTEAEYLTETLSAQHAALALLPARFKTLQRENEREIDLLCEKAGIMGEITALREKLEAEQRAIQSEADQIQGHIRALEAIYKQFHLAPIPEGVTHMYGIELEPLDPQTRLIVMHGQEGPDWGTTIEVLGGDPDLETNQLPPSLENEEEEEYGVVDALFAAPQPEEVLEDPFDLLEGVFEEERAPSASKIAHIADQISLIEGKVEDGTASDEDLMKVNELTNQLHDVLGE